MDEIIKRDQNHVTVLAGVTDDADQDIVMLRVDPISKRLLIKGSMSGDVVTSINGLTGAVILIAGSNITLTPVGNTITIASSGGASFWSRSTGFLYPTTLTDQVGIGTNTPLTTLSLDGSNNYGTLTFSSLATTTSQGGMGIESANDSIIVGATKGDLSIYGGTGKINFSADFGSTDQMVLTDTGFLGVGTTTPTVSGDFIGGTTVISSPSLFTSTIVLESLLSAGTDSVFLIYGPNDPTGLSVMENTAETGYTAQGQVINYYVYAYDTIGGTKYVSLNGNFFQLIDNIPRPQDNGSDNDSVENPAYSGYINNDTVHAIVYSYRNIGGTLYTSPTGITLGPLTLANNPSGFDWNWTAETNTDGSPVDGYVIVITDDTTSTVNSFDVGNVLTYADMNATGTATYNTGGIPFGSDLTWSGSTNGDGSPVTGYIVIVNDVNAGTTYSYDVGASTSYSDTRVTGTVSYQSFAGFTASGQSFTYDLYAKGTSPSGATYYNGPNSTSVTEMLNNGSNFWVSHTISSTGGNDWQEIENSSSGFQGTGDQTFYETVPYSGSGATTPLGHYGFLSDGMILDRQYDSYSFNTFPTLYSSTHTDSFTTDPNDGQYYYFQYTYATTANGIRTLENIDSAGFNGGLDWTGATPFYQDALGHTFNGPTTVTPNTIASTAMIAQNSAATTTDSSTLQVIATGGTPCPSVEWLNGSLTSLLKIGWDNASAVDYIITPGGNLDLRHGTTIKTRLYDSSSQFNVDKKSGYNFTVATTAQYNTFQVINDSDSVAFGGNANASAWANFSAGSTTKAQLNFSIQASAPSSPTRGDMWFGGTTLFFQNNNGSSNYTANVMMSGVAGPLSAGIPLIDANGNITRSGISTNFYPFYNGTSWTTGHLQEVSGVIVASTLQFEFKAGASFDAGQSMTMGAGSNITMSGSGTKIGTSTSEKLAFYNSTPIVQPTGSVITALQNLGLVGSATIPASTITSGAALTRINDTNVTLTLGGTPTTALLAATSLTLGWTGTLSVARGGTGQSTPVVVAGSVSVTGTATTTFTVTIGATQANTTYKVNVTPTSLVAAAVFYVNNKTTTTFDVVYLAGLTGAVAFDWALFT